MALAVNPFFNWADVLFAILLIRGGYTGYKKGFSTAVFTSSRRIAVALLSLVGGELSSRAIEKYALKEGWFVHIVLILVSAVILFILWNLVVENLLKLVKMKFAQALEKPGGVVLEVLGHAVMCSLVLYLLQLMPSVWLKASIMEKSFTGKTLVGFAEYISNLA